MNVLRWAILFVVAFGTSGFAQEPQTPSAAVAPERSLRERLDALTPHAERVAGLPGLIEQARRAMAKEEAAQRPEVRQRARAIALAAVTLGERRVAIARARAELAAIETQIGSETEVAESAERARDIAREREARETESTEEAEGEGE